MPPSRKSAAIPGNFPQLGFAIVDVLFGLLVLGIGLLGAGSAMIRNLQTSREISLVLRSADHAADLAELLATRPGAADAAAAIERWRSRTMASLPGGAQAEVSPLAMAGAGAALMGVDSARVAWNSSGARLELDLLVPRALPAGAP